MEPSKELKLNILSPERTLKKDFPITSLLLTGSEGEIEILPGHADMLGTMETGRFVYKGSNGENHSGFISTGFFEVSRGEVSLMAEVLELSDEIDVERAKKAQTRAQEELKKKELAGPNFEKYQLKLQRALIRQQVAGKKV